jgi:SNF2 family DNA or RNA helicase
MKWKPHDYQKTAIQFLIGNATAGLFLDPGLGKTSITLSAFKLLRSKNYVRRALVIAPLRPAHSVWPVEARLWDHLSDLKVTVLHGNGREISEDSDIDVINPEGLPWLLSALKGKRSFPWDMLIVDESTRFKHTNTKRFQLLRPLLPKFSRRVILTGSPAPNGLLDLFGQVFILDLGHALGRFITHYRVNYFDQTGWMGYDWVPRPGSEQAIYAKLRPLVLRMEAKELLEMPELIGVDPPLRVEVDLPAKARAQYDQMEKMLITQVEDEMVTAANAAAATIKCRQISNGGLYTNRECTEWSHIHEAKADAVEEIIEELQGKPALVAYEFKHDLDRLRKRFGAKTPYIGGGVSATRFREVEQAWNRGEIPVLLAQPQSVAHGLNLQGTGAAVIWHSLNWDLEVYEQFIRRVYRQGQKDRIVVHHVVAKDTVDEVILRGVAKKDRTQQALLGALKGYLKEKR